MPLLWRRARKLSAATAAPVKSDDEKYFGGGGKKEEVNGTADKVEQIKSLTCAGD